MRLRRRPQPKSVYIGTYDCPACSEPFTKVGEGNTAERISEGRTWVPWLELYADVEYRDKAEARAVERAVHESLRRHSAGGEVFQCDPDVAMRALERLESWSPLRIKARARLLDVADFWRTQLAGFARLVVCGLALFGFFAALEVVEGHEAQAPPGEPLCVGPTSDLRDCEQRP